MVTIENMKKLKISYLLENTLVFLLFVTSARMKIKYLKRKIQLKH